MDPVIQFRQMSHKYLEMFKTQFQQGVLKYKAILGWKFRNISPDVRM